MRKTITKIRKAELPTQDKEDLKQSIWILLSGFCLMFVLLFNGINKFVNWLREDYKPSITKVCRVPPNTISSENTQKKLH